MKLRIGLVVFPDFQLLDAAGPVAVFEVASHFAGSGRGYEVALVSTAGGRVPSSSGVAVESRPLRDFAAVDTLLVAGGTGTRDPGLDPGIIQELRRRSDRCRRIASVCTGAFLLARAGLLDGRRATTHWRHAAQLARSHPAVCVVPDHIWVNDGRFWTSAGVSAGIDLALALVTEDLGREVARRSAREVVVYYQRPGGQSQFSSIQELSDGRGRFAPLLAWIRANLAAPLRIEDLAARMAMSPRNFARRFRAEVGRTPAQAVVLIRLEVATTLVETTRQPIEQIARDTGFGDAECMRRAFLRYLGQPPRTLRTGTRVRPWERSEDSRSSIPPESNALGQAPPQRYTSKS
jgi:transcriptional regulator GlxA family with amidase domain